jgi:hypothetical protein
VLAVLALVFAGAAMFTGWAWLAYELNQQEMERRRADAVTPLGEMARALAHLTPEQTAIVQSSEFRAALEIAAGNDEPIYFLRTRTGAVPLAFVDDFLRDCGMVELRAIRTYSDGSPSRVYAQAMTDWCVQMGLATPATGPKPAMWIDENSKGRAFRLCGLEWEQTE